VAQRLEAPSLLEPCEGFEKCNLSFDLPVIVGLTWIAFARILSHAEAVECKLCHSVCLNEAVEDPEQDNLSDPRNNLGHRIHHQKSPRGKILVMLVWNFPDTPGRKLQDGHDEV